MAESNDELKIREVMRATLAEGSQIKPSTKVAVLKERSAVRSDRFTVEDSLLDELLEELGCKPVKIEVDELFPTTGVVGSYIGVFDQRMSPEVKALLSKVDLIITPRPGLTKYNIDGHTLSDYFGVKVCNIWNAVPRDSLDACKVPTELLEALKTRMTDIFLQGCEAGQEFRVTNPWGTDLRFTARPGDVNGDNVFSNEDEDDPMGLRLPDNNGRIYRVLAGFAAYETCDGQYVTMYGTALGGRLDEPLTVIIENGRAVDFKGKKPDVDRVRAMLDPSGHRIHALLTGLNPRYSVFNSAGEYIYAQSGAGIGSLEMTLGGPGLHYVCGQWQEVGRNHIQLGFVPKISYFVGGQAIITDGVPSILSDPEIVKLAESLGAAEQLVPIDWPHKDLPEVEAS